VRRDLAGLTERAHDLVVVGGGIFGACVAWDAALRGLSVALVEAGDFCHATSANSFKMVHGGVRYLQHADLARLRESVRERRALLRIAPHLVHPLPILIPTYGHGVEGPELLRAGLGLYDLLAADRNRGIRDPERRIPAVRALSREECLGLVPDLERPGLTGAVLFHDAQMYSPARLGLAFVRSAVEAGAAAANYVAATGFLRSATGIAGVTARDRLTGDDLEVRGRVVVNAAGPWAERLLADALGARLDPPSAFSRDLCFVTSRPAAGPYGLAVQGRTRDPDAVLARGARHLFLAPWRGRLLVGVWHAVWNGPPDELSASTRELQTFLDEANAAHPALDLTLDDVALVQAGLVLFGANAPGATDLSYGKRSRIVDHAATHGLAGLITVVGVRSTTARGVAAAAVDLACRRLGIEGRRSATETTPLYGGDVERCGELLEHARRTRPDGVAEASLAALVRNHGTEQRHVLTLAAGDPSLGATLGESAVLAAEAVHAVRDEMAVRLSDVVFRRTDLGTLGHPGEPALTAAAQWMGLELGWDRARAGRELDDVRGVYRKWAPFGGRGFLDGDVG
jgi:glycerol-3-phosphate dehydrogenase